MNGISIHVRTRSKVLDYRFVGSEAPADRWWEQSFGQWTDFARPTILVEPGRFFISGIASGRTDSKGARLHYALHGTVEQEGRNLAEGLIAHVCHVRGRTGSLEAIGLKLDQFGEDRWTAAVQGDQDSVTQLNTELATWIGTLLNVQMSNHVPEPSWYMAPGEQAFERLARTACDVLASHAREPKLAAYLNLAPSSELRELGRSRVAGIVCREVDVPPKSRRPIGAVTVAVIVGLLLIASLLWNWVQ